MTSYQYYIPSQFQLSLSESNYQPSSLSSLSSSLNKKAGHSYPSILKSKLDNFESLSPHEKLFYCQSRASSPFNTVRLMSNNNNNNNNRNNNKENHNPTNTLLLFEKKDLNDYINKNKKKNTNYQICKFKEKSDMFDNNNNTNFNKLLYNKNSNLQDKAGFQGIDRTGKLITRKKSPAKQNHDGIKKLHITGIKDIDCNYLLRR